MLSTWQPSDVVNRVQRWQIGNTNRRSLCTVRHIVRYHYGHLLLLLELLLYSATTVCCLQL